MTIVAASRAAASAPSRAGAGLVLVGVAVGAVGAFGLPLERPARFVTASYLTYHEFAVQTHGDAATQVFDGYRWWWQWAQLAAAILLAALAAALVAGLAARALGPVTGVLAVGLGVVNVLAYAHTPSVTALTADTGDGPSMFHYPSVGIWVGLSGLLALAIGAGLIGGAAFRAGSSGRS